jgi:hypothetical protein
MADSVESRYKWDDNWGFNGRVLFPFDLFEQLSLIHRLL